MFAYDDWEKRIFKHGDESSDGLFAKKCPKKHLPNHFLKKQHLKSWQNQETKQVYNIQILEMKKSCLFNWKTFFSGFPGVFFPIQIRGDLWTCGPLKQWFLVPKVVPWINRKSCGINKEKPPYSLNLTLNLDESPMFNHKVNRHKRHDRN